MVFDIQMVGSIDPNEIEVMEVLDMKNGLYRATCRLEACNKGHVAQDVVQVSINDHNHLFANFKVISNDTISTVVEHVTKSGVHQWKFDWTALLDDVPLDVSLEKGHHIEMCNDLLFSVETDAVGLKRLIEGDGLELCTRFSLANTRLLEECVCNLPVRDAKGAN
jgi:hypothetical protein